MISYKFFEILENVFFVEHLRTASSVFLLVPLVKKENTELSSLLSESNIISSMVLIRISILL